MKKKIAFICAKGLDNFIDPIIESLADDYWVRRIIITTQKEIHDAINWADIIWFEWCNETAIIGTRFPGINKKKVIIRLHSYEVLSELPKQINWENVDRLIFVAPHIRQILKEGIPDIEKKVKTSIIYNGLDIDNIPFKTHSPGFNIAWVGYINNKKNPQMALQIINELVKKDKRYKLYIAGTYQEARYKIYLEYMIKELGLQDNIIFSGWVNDMDKFWEDKNYLLHTSIHEGHCFSIMEAMAQGIKPVIHNFRGARMLYPDYLLFNTIPEATGEIIPASLQQPGKFIYSDESHLFYDSKFYRNWVIDKGWTLDNQMKQIKEIIKELRNGTM